MEMYSYSSNQLQSKKLSKLSEMPPNFIVYLQLRVSLLKSMGEGLTGIKTHYKERNLPTNISAVKNYNINKGDDSLLKLWEQ